MTRDIRLTSRTSGWIAIENAGGRNSVRTAEFLAKANAAGSLTPVCFGDKGYAGASTHAIKREHIVGFQDWAFEHGLNAAFDKAA